MTAERFRQIRNLFDAALERDPSERAAFLAKACHGDEDLQLEIEQLLLHRDEPNAWLDSAAATDERLEGRRIGPYEILRSLGEGGMGSVYLAARADGAFRKLVAIKIVRPESATVEVLRRFHQERDILASLEHPNIARILDGGETSDGLPHLAMEYIDGKPIDVYSDEHRLTVRERIGLFDQVCSAVQYAHTRHVVHRDLKPSNVLVTAAGEVKLLDFGIAKVLASGEETTLLRTRSDLRLMTPEYASPEQVRGESVTPSSDIYALGVLLYELLTGRRPYRLRSRVFHEVVRVICEEPPTRPSTVVTQRGEAEDDPDRAPEDLGRMRSVSPKDLRRELAGNLDAILLKTLEKDPLQRYRSVAELNRELQNHLSGESVLASKSRRLDALEIFARRHPWWIPAALGFAVVCLNSSGLVVFLILTNLAGLALGLWLLRREYGGSLPPKFWETGLKRVAFLGLMLFAFFSLWKKLSHPDYDTIMTITAVIVVPLAIYGVVRWLLRKKFLGPLLLDLSHRKYWPLVAISAVVAGAIGVALSLEITDVLHSDSQQPFVYFHVANRPQKTIQSGYEDTSLPITAYGTLSEQPEVFSTVIAFAPLFTPLPDGRPSDLPSSPGVPIRFGSQSGKALGEEVSGNFFSDLHVPLYLGRGFTSGDEMRSARVVVLSYDWWTRRLASQPTALGETLYIKGLPFTITGVTPPGFRGVDPYTAIDFWMPLQTSPTFSPWGTRPAGNNNFYTSPDWYCLMLLGRLQPGITQQQAVAKLRPAFQRANSTGTIISFDPRKSGLYFSPAIGVKDWGHSLATQRKIQDLCRHAALLVMAISLVVKGWIFGRIELRKHGFAKGEAFIRWPQIGAYFWEPKRGEFEMLQLRLAGKWKWSPIPLYIPVKRNLRPQVDYFLKQQFEEWPT